MATQHRPSALDLFSVAARSLERSEAGLSSSRHNLPSSADARPRFARVKFLESMLGKKSSTACCLDVFASFAFAGGGFSGHNLPSSADARPRFASSARYSMTPCSKICLCLHACGSTCEPSGTCPIHIFYSSRWYAKLCASLWSIVGGMRAKRAT